MVPEEGEEDRLENKPCSAQGRRREGGSQPRLLGVGPRLGSGKGRALRGHLERGFPAAPWKGQVGGPEEEGLPTTRGVWDLGSCPA